MIFKRKIYNKLLDWKTKSNGTKAILIEGARRIGKSTIAEEFGKNNYKSYVLIDFIIISGDKTNVKISPIEVKSSKKYTTTSLEKFNLTFKKRISNSYIIHPKNLSIRDDGIICIPAYMTFCL